MSIENNLGIVSMINDMSSTGNTGSVQNTANGVPGNPQDSIFQNLINRLLMQKNSNAAAAAGLDNGEQKQQGNISELLSGLLLGGSISKGKLQSIMKALGESDDSAQNAATEGTTDEIGASLEMLQAMMLGVTNTAAMTGNEKNSELQTSTTQTSQTIGAIQSSTSELRILGNQRFILFNNEQGNSLEDNSELSNASSTESAADSSLKSLNMNGAAAIGQENQGQANATDLVGQVTPEKPNEMMKKQDMLAQQEFQISGADSKNQAAVIDSKSSEEIAGSFEKTKQETDGNQPIELEDQSPLQSTGSAAGSAEIMNQLPQSVEKTEPYAQIGNEILSKLEQKGPTEFKMQLEPENLGQIDIKLKLNDGKLMIDILAANSKTHELLIGQVDKLISSMGLQNVKVENVQVSQQMNSQSQGSQSQGFAMNSGMDFSQSKQQEQFQQEFFRDSSIAAMMNSQQNETQTMEETASTRPIRYDLHRMNYAV